MRLVVATLAFLLVATSALSQDNDEPDDMKECIEEIRAWGMSENAKGTIGMVAGMRLGGYSWIYNKDESSGAYWNAYQGNRCNLPNDDPIEAERERTAYQYNLDSEIMKLKKIADSDGSGFVSTAEGREFRSLVEFGYKAAFIVEAEKGDIEAIVIGLSPELKGGDKEAFTEMLKDYKALKALAAKHDIENLPDVIIE